MTAQAPSSSAGYRPAQRLRLVASEAAASYAADSPGGARLDTLTGALDAFLSVSLDELDEEAITAEVTVLERARRRFDARIARASDVLAERQARRAAQANPKDKRAQDRARREVHPEDAAEAEQRRHARRRASVTQTADGMTRIYAELAAVDGAVAARAIDTFRRQDVSGEHRRPEQRTADALVDLARAALRADGTDNGSDTSGSEGGNDRPSRNHGTRPHVVVTIPIDVLLAGAGMVDLDGTDVPLDAVTHLLDDAGRVGNLPTSHTTSAPCKKPSQARDSHHATTPEHLARWRIPRLRRFLESTCALR